MGQCSRGQDSTQWTLDAGRLQQSDKVVGPRKELKLGELENDNYLASLRTHSLTHLLAHSLKSRSRTGWQEWGTMGTV